MSKPVHRLSRVSNHLVMLSYELNKEKVTQGRSGAKRCTVTLRDEGRLDGIVITTTMPTVQGQMHLIETRRLLDKGKSHSQVSLGWTCQRRVRRGEQRTLMLMAAVASTLP